MQAVPNESFWLEAIERGEPLGSLKGEHRADVICVGGGYTSLVTAYLLKKRDPSLDVAVVEGNYVGFGSSGRNGGMVLHQPHLDRVGARGARAVRFTYDQTVASVDFIEELSSEEGFDCELERTGYLDIALHQRHLRENEEKQARCDSLGIQLEIKDLEAMQGAIRSDRFLGALHYPKAAILHPGKYVFGLKAAALRRGVKIYENSPVETMRRVAGGVELRTAQGSVQADQAVVGLNAYLPTQGLVSVRPRAVSLFSFIILTEPLSAEHWKTIGWQGRQGYSDKRRLHNYVRLTGNRVLFGGRVRYRFGLQATGSLMDVYETLHQQLIETFPSLKDVAITHRWCGPVAITWSRRPWIGREGPISAALGYSGMGVSLATLSGRVLADLVMGEEKRWSDLLYLNDPMLALPPEPFRFLGFQGGYYAMRVADLLDQWR